MTWMTENLLRRIMCVFGGKLMWRKERFQPLRKVVDESKWMLELVHKKLWDWTNYTTPPCLDKSECLGSGVSNDDDGVMRSGVIHLARKSRSCLGCPPDRYRTRCRCRLSVYARGAEEKKENFSTSFEKFFVPGCVSRCPTKKKSARTDPDETPLGLISVTGLRQLNKER